VLNCSVGVFSTRDPFAKVKDFPQIEGLKSLFSVVRGDEPACCLNLLYKIGGDEEVWPSLEKNQVEFLELEGELCGEIEVALRASSLYLSKSEKMKDEKMKDFMSGFLPL
jgi:hypothetical protein